ncbi:xylan 1,4-beta-xylosidase [Lachnospiraceae bacterium NE2001]|nr:xylan 1,4-beta-xylosidase [Lachnospiraceae bacterium NE2001]
MNKRIIVDGEGRVDFHNNVDSCVGTGRWGLALTEEYLKELEFVQGEMGFKLIRGHGIFHDDLSIYHEYEEDGEIKLEYNYTYLFRIIDRFLEIGIRPYLELSFMPSQLAKGTQTLFHWKANTTPPKEYRLWADMVVALLKNLRARYGEEVLDWPIEVWNEPNLPGFWYKADMDEYFKLFKETYEAVKAYDSRFKVGGPAICGVNEEEWIREFLTFCIKYNLKPDNITRHHYTVEFPESIGHYDYSKLEDSDMRINNLQATRDLVDSFDDFKGTPIHITEFSTSYTPRGVIHDTNLNAAYLAHQLSRLGDMNELYSYWTFGDVFEEKGVPNSLFHGGFGMVAAGCIPKPTFWTFSFYKHLKEFSEICVHRDENSVIVKSEEGYAGILWNKDEEDLSAILALPFETGEYTLITKTVDEECCNPLKLWHDIGEPAYPTKEETELIRSGAYPLINSSIVDVNDDSTVLSFDVRKHGIIYFELTKRRFTPDRGYDYNKVLTHH